jgi:hypothetical protein
MSEVVRAGQRVGGGGNRVKSARIWIGSVTTIEGPFRWKGRVHPSHQQPRSDSYPEQAHGGTRVPIGRNAGGHAEAGMESGGRDGV